MADKTKFPNWAAVTPENIAGKLPRLLRESEEKVAAIEKPGPDTYETLQFALDDATRELFRTWGFVGHMTSVCNSEAWRKIEADFQPEIVKFSLRLGQSKRLNELSKNVLLRLMSCGNRSENEMRIRILEKSIQGFELAGVSLDGAEKARFNEIQAELAKLSMDFANAVLDATGKFKFEKDGKIWTIDDASYPETMKNCADREVREALYRGRSMRAPENTERIAKILELRREKAKLLGFEDPANLSLATKCAPSVAAVFEMIDELDKATKEPAAKEDGELADFAAQKLEPWDMAYYAERLREKKYSYSEEELKKHLEFTEVLGGLFTLTKLLFNVDIREITGSDKPSVWHKDVRFFEVDEAGRTIAHFYLDPFVRNGEKHGGAWMNEFANRDDRRGETPLAVLVLNLPRPDESGKCLMPLREVETLFHEFGHSLQHMLTKIGEEDAAGLNLIEWDAVEVASQFMENWCLDERTGIKVPAELKAKVVAAKNFRAASACRRQLAFAKTAMMLHSGATPENPDAVKNANFEHFGLPYLKGDLFLNAFTHIFAGGYAAGYYGYKWSEVMSADCYGAFEEAGLGNDEAVKSVGAKYRETILALGGSESAYEVFQRFRGRKPGIDALLRQQGLK